MKYASPEGLQPNSSYNSQMYSESKGSTHFRDAKV